MVGGLQSFGPGALETRLYTALTGVFTLTNTHVHIPCRCSASSTVRWMGEGPTRELTTFNYLKLHLTHFAWPCSRTSGWSLTYDVTWGSAFHHLSETGRLPVLNGFGGSRPAMGVRSYGPC